MPSQLPRSKTHSLDSWLDTATRGLCDEAKARIATEIGSHVSEAEAANRDRGFSRHSAHVRAVADLGDPKEARRIFKRIHLTQFEASLASQGSIFPNLLNLATMIGINVSNRTTLNLYVIFSVVYFLALLSYVCLRKKEGTSFLIIEAAILLFTNAALFFLMAKYLSKIPWLLILFALSTFFFTSFACWYVHIARKLARSKLLSSPTPPQDAQ